MISISSTFMLKNCGDLYLYWTVYGLCSKGKARILIKLNKGVGHSASKGSAGCRKLLKKVGSIGCYFRKYWFKSNDISNYFFWTKTNRFMLFKPSIIQSINPSILQSFNPSILQSFSPSILQSVNPSILQSFNPSILQLFNPSILQFFNPSIL